METSEYDFYYEPYRRVPMNSATTPRDFIDYQSIGTLSTYNIWPRSFKRIMSTTYIDGATILGCTERPSTTKDSFPKGKSRRKPLIPFERKMDARDAYMSLLPTDRSIVDTSTIRSERTRSPFSMATATQTSNFPEVKHKNVDVKTKRLLSATVRDDDENNQGKIYGRSATIHTNDAWIRRYKSMNESQILSNLLRDQSARDKILLKKRSSQQLFTFSSSSSSSLNSSFIKRKRDKC